MRRQQLIGGVVALAIVAAALASATVTSQPPVLAAQSEPVPCRISCPMEHEDGSYVYLDYAANK